MSHPRRVHRAFTLIETMISMAIISMTLVAALESVAGVARMRTIMAQTASGPAMARDLLNEVVSQRYRDPAVDGSFGLEAATGEVADDRRTFDDVDDYHGWFASPPRLRNGDPIDMYEGWSRQVQVTRVNPTTLAATGSDSGLVWIVVTATDACGRTSVVSSLRSPQAGAEQPFVFDRSQVHHVSLDLEITGAGVPFTGGTNL